MKKKIAIFASGRGSNAQAIIESEAHLNYKVQLVVSSKANAKVLDLAEENNIASIVLNKPSFTETEELLEILKKHQIDYICLAGFLWKIPSYLIKAFPNKIINIHPSLLPKYGGKGMYGMNVHQAVILNDEAESGITIHLVNEEYDKGRILLQRKIALETDETAESLAAKILQLEHEYFPQVINEYCKT